MSFTGSVFIVFVALVSSADALRCRFCVEASGMDECEHNADCLNTEECFLDKERTVFGTIVYNAGCRQKSACSSQSGTVVGRRSLTRRDSVVLCSECCSDNTTIGGECNTKLCGVTPPHNQCYICDQHADSKHQGPVRDPSLCSTITTCKNRYHREQTCVLMTKGILEEVKLCKTNSTVTTRQCAERSRPNICSVCCGDPLCNGLSCFDLIEYLYALWEIDHLSLTSLRKMIPFG